MLEVSERQEPTRKLGSHLFVHFSVRHTIKAFYTVVEWFADSQNTFNERPTYLPRHKSQLAIGDNFIGFSSSWLSTGTLYPHIGDFRTVDVEHFCTQTQKATQECILPNLIVYPSSRRYQIDEPKFIQMTMRTRNLVHNLKSSALHSRLCD